jgi:NOL1/NOP2/fmu family ribosome biogenesis protein/23S rRNA U2552 (ribose-2'-O)-methylase RlmE/FtsJ
MDASSMIIGQVLGQHIPDPAGMRVLDMCAAPGGKSAVLSNFLGKESLLISNEVIRSRYSILEEVMAKWGNPSRLLVSIDPDKLKALGPFFDCIVVDAPCSGEGLFRKTPVAAKHWSPDHVRHCSIRQKRILQAAYDLLKQNGLMLYSTCTYNAKENIENCMWLTAEFQLESLQCSFPEEWGLTEIINEGTFGYQIYPHRTGTEGFFFALFRKPGSQTQIIPSALSQSRKSRKEHNLIKPGSLPHGYELPKGTRSVRSNHDILLIPEYFQDEIRYFREKLPRITPGIHGGTFKGTDFIPSAELAMLQGFSMPEDKYIPLLKEEAVQYLKKEQLNVGRKEPGWYLASYQGCILGWVKNTKSGLKNYFPMHWRIRN